VQRCQQECRWLAEEVSQPTAAVVGVQLEAAASERLVRVRVVLVRRVWLALGSD
jgi:hypothetical protein